MQPLPAPALPKLSAQLLTVVCTRCPPPQDFSYLDTPTLPVESENTTIIPRLALPNPHVPAFLNGSLAWGGQPAGNRPQPTGQAWPGGAAWPAAESAEAAAALPAGVACVPSTDGRGQSCGCVCSGAEEGAEEVQGPFCSLVKSTPLVTLSHPAP